MRVRIATPEDGAALAAIYAPFVRDTRVSFEEEAPSAEEMAARIARGLRTHAWLVLEDEGVVGYAYGSSHRERAGYRWAVDVTIYLAESHRGRGLGRVLYGALFPLLRAQGFVVAYAGISLPNPGSVGLHESLGFRPVGIYRAVGYKAGAWHDVGWWELDLAERASPPAEPIPFADLPRMAPKNVSPQNISG